MVARRLKSITALGMMPESEHCRARARECRALAGHLHLDFAREHMLKAAADFDRNALEIREREITHGMSRIGELVRGLRREA
jgi:hypothetical protein